MKFTAVITLTDYQEDFTRALTSITKTSDYFADIFIVTKNRDAISKYLPSRECALNLMVVPKFKQKEMLGNIVLNVHPYDKFKESDIIKLKDRIKNSNRYQTVFAISSVIVSNPDPMWMWINGFLLVDIVWSWIQSFWDRNKLYNNTDLIAQCVVSKGGKNYTAPSVPTGIFARFSKSEYSPKIYSDTSVIKAPVNNFEDLLRHFSSHNFYGMGLWILVYFGYWISLIGGIFYPIILGNVSTFLILLSLIFQACIIMLITNAYVKMPIRFLLCLLYPAFFVAFPFVIIASKLYKPKKQWK